MNDFHNRSDREKYQIYINLSSSGFVVLLFVSRDQVVMKEWPRFH